MESFSEVAVLLKKLLPDLKNLLLVEFIDLVELILDEFTLFSEIKFLSTLDFEELLTLKLSFE